MTSSKVIFLLAFSSTILISVLSDSTNQFNSNSLRNKRHNNNPFAAKAAFRSVEPESDFASMAAMRGRIPRPQSSTDRFSESELSSRHQNFGPEEYGNDEFNRRSGPSGSSGFRSRFLLSSVNEKSQGGHNQYDDLPTYSRGRFSETASRGRSSFSSPSSTLNFKFGKSAKRGKGFGSSLAFNKPLPHTLTPLGPRAKKFTPRTR